MRPEMVVELVAYTTIAGVTESPVPGWKWQSTEATVDDPYGLNQSDLDEVAEFAGRLCYQSWAKPNPATATNRGYLANILQQGHESVLEHASATFYVAGVSRSLSHELVRHRHLSFSQLSQRFHNESDAKFVVPPAIAERIRYLASQAGYDAQALTSHLRAVSETAAEVYERLVNDLTTSGLTRKQAREAARCVLPNATETKFVVTGNMRAWRDVLKRRLSPTADAEIRLLAQRILAILKDIAPNTFQDSGEWLV